MCAYRNLPLWQRAMDLAEVIHRSTSAFPWTERLGLMLQLRRLALGIPLQVAEHYNRRAAIFLVGLRRAQRMLRALDHQVVMADRLEYWSPEQGAEIASRLAEVRRLLQAFLRSLCPPAEY